MWSDVPAWSYARIVMPTFPGLSDRHIVRNAEQEKSNQPAKGCDATPRFFELNPHSDSWRNAIFLKAIGCVEEAIERFELADTSQPCSPM